MKKIFSFYQELFSLQNQVTKGEKKIQNEIETAKKIDAVKQKIAAMQN